MTHSASAVWIIDCTERRNRLLERTAQAVSSCKAAAHVAVNAVARYQDVALGDLPTLILWHMGGRQDTQEGGYLARQIKSCAWRQSLWIAGFSGDDRTPELSIGLPKEGDRFAVLWKVNTTKDVFWEALAKTIGLWTKQAGALSKGDLESAWLGFDPELEAKLEILAALFEGRETREEYLQRLSDSHRSVIERGEDIASLRTAFLLD